jgi:hypothetical protein
MDIAELLRRNRAPRKQVGAIIETPTAFFGRYYTSDTYDNGRRKPKAVIEPLRSLLEKLRDSVNPRIHPAQRSAQAAQSRNYDMRGEYAALLRQQGFVPHPDSERRQRVRNDHQAARQYDAPRR